VGQRDGKSLSGDHEVKVVYVIHHPGQGGMEKHVYILAKYALAAGNTVDFVFDHDGPLVSRVRSLGCAVHFVRMRAPYDPIAVYQLVGLFRKLEPDVVHTHFMRETFLVIDASKFVKIPAIFNTIHRLEKKNEAQEMINKLYSRSLTKVIAVSQLAKQYALDEGIRESKIITILNGSESPDVNTARVRADLGVKKTDKLITYVGRFTSEKGHRTLLKAFSSISKPGQKLLLAGDGPLRDEMEKLAKKLKIEKQVVFTEVINNGVDVAADYVAASDLYVQPSEIENLPTSVIEAMLYSVPVVASDCRSHEQLLKSGELGYLFKNRNAKNLAQVIEFVLVDKSRGQKVKGAKEYADLHLTAAKMWGSTEKLYQKYAKSNVNVLR
jgi:L-malate glycosyltransferase